MALEIIGPQYCAPGTMDLSIARNVMTLTGGNFAVTDVNGNLVLKVEEKLILWGQKIKHLLDPHGNPIITFRRKVMISHTKWEVFRGDSVDGKHLIFTCKAHPLFYRNPKLDVFLANNTVHHVCDFQVKGSYFDQSCIVYAGDANSNALVAEMHKTNTSGIILLTKDNFRVTINPNVDYAFIVALIVIFDDINRKRRRVF